MWSVIVDLMLRYEWTGFTYETAGAQAFHCTYDNKLQLDLGLVLKMPGVMNSETSQNLACSCWFIQCYQLQLSLFGLY